jgi:hypothetical protein
MDKKRFEITEPLFEETLDFSELTAVLGGLGSDGGNAGQIQCSCGSGNGGNAGQTQCSCNGNGGNAGTSMCSCGGKDEK